MITEMTHTLFISDIHLDSREKHITNTFLKFLSEKVTDADALYILGDFFEFWIGDDDHNDFHQHIINALKTLTKKGFPIYFMRGNRDFLIGKQFAEETGITLLPDPTVIHLYGKPILLTHGDSLCTLDIKMQKFRKRTMNPLYRWLFLSTPISFRRYAARKGRAISQQHQKQVNLEILDVNPITITEIMKKYEVDILIHGHTHRPDIHNLTINNEPAKRIVLGSWHTEGSFLKYSSEHRFSLARIPHKKLQQKSKG